MPFIPKYAWTKFCKILEKSAREGHDEQTEQFLRLKKKQETEENFTKIQIHTQNFENMNLNIC